MFVLIIWDVPQTRTPGVPGEPVKPIFSWPDHVRRRWLTPVSIVMLIAVAAAEAFPKLIGSDDSPNYGLVVVWLALAVYFWISRRSNK